MEKTRSETRESAYCRQSAGRKLCILTILSALFAFFGWVGETVLFMIVYKGEYHDRGLLTLPFCPLYGLGALAVYLLLRTPQSGIWARIIDLPHSRAGRAAAIVFCLLAYAFAAALFTSLIEYFTGMFFDKRFGVHLWSYYRYPDNINGYVSIRYSLLWGLLCVSAMGLVWYPAANILAKANTAVLVVSAVVFFVAITADFIFNMVYLYLRGSRYMPLGESLLRNAIARVKSKPALYTNRASRSCSAFSASARTFSCPPRIL